MPKRPLPYQCGHCGVRFPKWMGRCPDCGEWESVREDLALYGGKVVPLTRGRAAPKEDGEGEDPGPPAGMPPNGKPPPRKPPPGTGKWDGS